MKDTREVFIEAIIAAGIKPPQKVISDGIIHRYSTNDKPNDEAGWYVYNDYGTFSAGAYGCWRMGVSRTWHTNMDRTLTSQEEKIYQEKIEKIRLEADAENERRHVQAREEANRIIKASTKAPEDFPYLVKKQVYIKGVLFYNERLVIPMFDEYGSPQGLQFIDKNGIKRTLKGSRLKGSYFPIGKPEKVLCFSESISTGGIINKATGYAVAVVFGTHNLLPAAQILRKKFPETLFVFCADDDYHLPDNPEAMKKILKKR